MTPSARHDHPLVILGTGYTGRRLYEQARTQGWNTRATSRVPESHLSTIQPEHRLHFDLHRADTWRAIPARAHIIWCFPAVPLHLVQAFADARPSGFAKLIVLGSTSAYRSDGGLVTEQTPLHHDLPRVQGEEYLRTCHGAIILRLAGLYGPGRHVLDWIRKGKIQHTRKWVNLLHVEDAAAICLKLLDEGQEGTSFVASDGTPRRWADIMAVASSMYGIPVPPPAPLQEAGKKVSVTKLLTELNYIFRFPDLYEAFKQIESPAESRERRVDR